MAKNTLVICILKYYDIELDRHVFKNEKLEVTLKRGKELIKADVCELIKIE